MISLHGKASIVDLSRPLDRSVWKLVNSYEAGHALSSTAVLLDDTTLVPPGFRLYIGKSDVEPPANVANYVRLPPQLDHLEAGDVLSVSLDGQRLRVLWRRRSRQNSVLLTERCDHYCLMCSQPPKKANDDWLLNQAFEVIRLLPAETTDIGLTGGEPTLYGEQFLDLLQLCRDLHPGAAVHTLSNGRRFNNFKFAAAYAAVDNPEMMVGIPLYGSEPSLHDYVVQARGAFNDTVRGIMNLGQLDQRIELRVVIHKQTAPHLVEIAEFISRNLPFVEHVALMGLEMTGLARANVDDIWIDQSDYRQHLTDAVTLLDRMKIRVMIYNHQLCLIDREVWPYAVRSISDWKNEYHDECGRCSVAAECGGFFATSNRISEHILAIVEEPVSVLAPTPV